MSPIKETVLSYDYRTYENARKRRDNAQRQMDMMADHQFSLYLTKKPADEPHDSDCQKSPTRFGDTPLVACTCKINDVRRREAINRAGAAGDRIVLSSLGAYESSRWHEAYRGEPRGTDWP